MITFDNTDERIRYFHLELERDLPAHFDEPSLPEGYHFSFYQPGDRDAWIAIEISAKELKDYAQGLEVWDRYYGPHVAQMPWRMVFVENTQGEKVATATAFFDSFGVDDGILGWLHWVAVRREDQGRGISKPLIAHTLNRLIELGYRRAHISTQCTTWVACKVYLDFGFLPVPENAEQNKTGWDIVRTLTRHPALDAFDLLPESEIVRPGVLTQDREN